jgi:hypothetical protein
MEVCYFAATAGGGGYYYYLGHVVFKISIMFSLKMVHMYRNMLEKLI